MTTFVKALDHTARNCRYGCGLMVVLVDQYGDGRTNWVHCGTYNANCPQEPRPVPRWRG